MIDTKMLDSENMISICVVGLHDILYRKPLLRQGSQQNTGLFLKPNWHDGFKFIHQGGMGLRRLDIGFSNDFYINDDREIERYKFNSLKFLPGFGIIIT